ncbi:protein lethal(2)denticleless [Microplitis demolitor]|uniref:protein lethal(2)denticleless n=1 Tax=Microplitis demolitor TaxID=69319 RepID=UPI0004CDA46E|nr:protein lethal(2)denticleless [Microplitis demolitor]
MSNIVNSLERRFTGFATQLDYDIAIRRLKCYYCDVYRGVSVNPDNHHDFTRDPLIFACKFSTSAGWEDTLALASEDGRIALQDTTVKSEEPHLSMEGTTAHYNAIFDINWMPGEMKLITASGDHSIKLWDVDEEKITLLNTFNCHDRCVKTAIFRPEDKSVFVSGARDGNIFFWDIRAKHPHDNPKPDSGIYNAHGITKVATTNNNNSRSRHRRRSLVSGDRAQSITGLAFQDNNTLISCGAGDGIIKIWDMRKHYTIHKKEPIPKHTFKYKGGSTRNGFTSLAVCPSSLILYVNCMDNIIYSYNLSSYNQNPMAEYYGHQNCTYFVKSCLSPDGKYLLSGSTNEHAYIWKTSKPGGPIFKLCGHTDEVTSVAWKPYGEPVIATACDDGFHRIWRVGLEEKGDNDEIEIQGRASPIPITMHPQQSKLESTPTFSGLRKSRFICSPDSDIAYTSNGSDADHSNIESPDIMTPGSSAKRKYSQMSMSNYYTENNKFKTILSPIRENEQPCKRANMEMRGARRLFSPTSTRDAVSISTNKCLEPQPGPSTSLDQRQILFSPTMNLPNFVIDGTAPHLIHRSPIKSKENVDWLTKIRQTRYERFLSQIENNSININSSNVNTSNSHSNNNNNNSSGQETTPGRKKTRSRSRSTENRIKSPAVSLLKFFKRDSSTEKDTDR